MGYSIWWPAPGSRRGVTRRATDDLGYNAAEVVTPVHDLHATTLAALAHDAAETCRPLQYT